MAASADDLLMKVSIATATTLDAPGYTISDTSITVGSTSTWPTDTGITFAMDEVDAGGERVAGSYNEYVGTVASGTSITNVFHVNGTDRSYTASTTTRVYIPVSEERENRIVTWGLTHADQDGTLKAGAVDVAGVLASDVVTNAKILNSTVELNAKAAPWDGWTAGSGTWTYASATTFTVPAADAAVMSVGTKIGITQTTAKYFYVTGVSGTTITVNGGTDYSVANAAITLPKLSNGSTPFGFPTNGFAWTPTWANFTIGDGTNACKFTMNGKTVFYRVLTTLGSTSSMGTAPTFTLPVTSAATPDATFPIGTLTCNGSRAGVVGWATTTTGKLYVMDTNSDLGTVNATNPFPGGWLNGYKMLTQGRYEAA